MGDLRSGKRCSCSLPLPQILVQKSENGRDPEIAEGNTFSVRFRVKIFVEQLNAVNRGYSHKSENIAQFSFGNTYIISYSLGLIDVCGLGLLLLLMASKDNSNFMQNCYPLKCKIILLYYEILLHLAISRKCW